MSQLDGKINRLKSDVRRLDNITKKLSEFPSGVSFNYSEQELVRRILKSVLNQIKNKEDYNTALSILSKTEWLDNER